MAKAIIKRLGFKADTGAFMANALKVVAGAANVKITLRGSWRTMQGNSLVRTPCSARTFANGDIEVEYGSSSVLARAESGATMDIEARIEREVRNS